MENGAGLLVAILISANAEWKAVKPLFSGVAVDRSPYGEFFQADLIVRGRPLRALFVHGGWGKIAAAASAQWTIDRFRPKRLINLGTCGGVEGRVRRFDVVAVEKVVVYDIAEAMGDSAEAIAHYTTVLELPQKLPVPAVRTTLYSADRDLTPRGLAEMESRFHPSAVDWESGAIAWVARRNATPLLILRGVSDLVSLKNGEAEGRPDLFEANAAEVMRALVRDLPKWLEALEPATGKRSVRRPPAGPK